MNPTAEELNKIGYRELLDGSEYDSFLPSSNCERTEVVYGKGKEGIILILKWISKYSEHTNSISKILKKPTLKETIDCIHWFLSNHIQYKTREPHEILSPACAWASREEGTDCKSFTVFASSLLMNLRIKHYIRAVETKIGNHIYVVVPIDQEHGRLNENSILKNDYFIIDGTGYNNKEIEFALNYDIFMNPTSKIINKVWLGLFALGITCFILNNKKEKV